MTKTRGVSLTEYGFIACIVMLAALPGLFKLSQELTESFSLMLATQSQPPFPGEINSQHSALGNTQAMQAPLPSPSLDGLSGEPLSLSTSDLVGKVQTLGVNGTTTLLANSLSAISSQLKEEGTIDENTYNAIVALANQGHTLARIEASVESAAKAAGDGGGSAFDRAKSELDGKLYSGPELVAMLNNNSSNIQVFRELQNKVLNDVSLTNPAIKPLISNLSNNILNIAEAASTSGDWISRDGGGVNSYKSFKDDFPELLADYSAQTTVNSNEICGTQTANTSCRR